MSSSAPSAPASRDESSRASYRDLQSRAREQFPPSRFVHAPGVCVFVEHETLGADGEPLKFDAEALAAIVEACNARIGESDAFPVLAAGHTPTPDERAAGVSQPEVVGFCGPFRLGTFGASKKTAIFVDEWRRRDAIDVLSKLPRRSVELWRASEPQSAFIDPVAALGAQTPRLALGLNYSHDGGQAVVPYSAAAPSEPARPSDAVAVEAAGAEQEPSAIQASAPEPLRDDVREWLARSDVQATLERYFAQRLVEPQRVSAEPSPSTAAASETNAEPVVETVAAPPPEPESDLAKAHAALCFSMERLQRESADLRRESRLERIARSQALDLEAEKERCLYARGSRMADDDFDRHVETLQRYQPVDFRPACAILA